MYGGLHTEPIGSVLYQISRKRPKHTFLNSLISKYLMDF